MQTKYFVLAAAMVCVVSMNAQTGAQTNYNDTLRTDTSMFKLAEVTVEAQNVIQKVDKQVLLPNKEQRRASHDGMSLLQNLQIPPRTTGVPATYDSHTRHVPDDSTPKIASFSPSKVSDY